MRVLLCLLCFSLGAQNAAYVNPFIGTGGHGHTFPGPVWPFGMVQLGPDTRADGSWDGCSGYHYDDQALYGFSHTHLSGTGVSDWGDILLTPFVDTPRFHASKPPLSFSHANEKAGAGFYKVMLANQVKVELTVTQRVGIHRYTFAGDTLKLVLDLLHRDRTFNCKVMVRDSVTVVGFRISEGWARKQEVYFAMKFSRPFSKMAFAQGEKITERLDKFGGRTEGGCFYFAPGGPLTVKVALSPTGVEGALKNLEAEAPHWNFEQYERSAIDAWNKQLGKIDVPSGDKDKLPVFYTALYHCFIHPSLNMDVDGKYRGRDGAIHTALGFVNYSVFSLWDTYRALHPLFTIVERRRTTDFIGSFLAQYQQSGRLPVWELSGNETDCMIGFHAASVIADAMQKGIRGFDSLLAYEAVKAAASYSASGIPAFNQNGYLQVAQESESVSKTLEYGYDNWCVGLIAQRLNLKEAPLYFRRSKAWINLFDQSSGFMRPRKNGYWLEPFDPAEVNNHYTEANSWQYSFAVPHDISALMAAHGGSENFEKKLDALFGASELSTGRAQSDISGMMGQYAHGNEPSHHVAYLYNFAGKPAKTVEKIRQICTKFYHNSPDGLIGNDDCGQMSAWYVFASLGFYPVCPGDDQYILGEPQFNTLRLNFENGRSFTVTATPVAGKKISEVSLNKKTSFKSYISQTDLLKGGSLAFLYTETIEDRYGINVNAPTTKAIGDAVAAPLIVAPSSGFDKSVKVAIQPLSPAPAACMYAINGPVTRKSAVYKGPLNIDSTCTINTKLYTANDSSATSSARFIQLKRDQKVTLLSRTHPQYGGDGASTLIDGVSGDVDWRKGGWLGFQGHDFECVLDRGRVGPLRSVTLGSLQDSRAWILLPVDVEFYVSSDGVNYKLLTTLKPNVSPHDNDVQVYKFTCIPEKPTTARYIKVVAKNFHALPAWHGGTGGMAYVFVDELVVE